MRFMYSFFIGILMEYSLREIKLADISISKNKIIPAIENAHILQFSSIYVHALP